jgi:hypothetical protein
VSPARDRPAARKTCSGPTWRRCAAVAGRVLLVAGCGTSNVEAQTPEASDRGWQPRISRIVIDSVAVRPVLRELWEASVETAREQVACIGGRRQGREFRIARAAELRAARRLSAGGSAGGSLANAGTGADAAVEADGGIGSGAAIEAAGDIDSDSVSVSREWSRLSVDVCGPPEWVGTVHTHRIEGGEEHPGLSSNDRAVVSLWHARWRHESVFCVLYSPEKPPYCEHRS